MTPGLGEFAPMSLPDTAGDHDLKEREDAGKSTKDPKPFESVMSQQMRKSQKTDRSSMDEQPEELEASEVRYDKGPPDPDREVAVDPMSYEAPEDVGQKQKVDAMLKFMDSMESELGIEPEQMLQAMRDVQAEGENITHEQAIAKALAKVDVQPGQVDRAAELYAEFLVAAEYGASSLQKKGAVPVSDMNFNVMTREQLRKSELESSVNQMRSSFFDTEDSGLQKLTQQAGLTEKRNPIQVPDLMNLDPGSGQEVAEGEVYNPGNMGRSLSQRKPDSMDTMMSMMEKPKTSMDMMNVNLSSQSNMMGEIDAQSLNNSGLDANADLMNGMSMDGSMEGFEQSDLDTGQSGQDFDSDPGFSEEGDAFSLQNTVTRTSTAKATSELAQSSEPAVDVENANDLVDQAQLLVRKGGGEMKVRLNPEGLGQVNLKVDVQDGNVNIQMVADHSEAKKALEKGIKDLKENLALQRMNVENIKVDVSSELSKHLENAEKEENYQREYARDFMGKMRDGNQSSYEGFLSHPAQEYYGQEREEVDPIELGAASAQSSKNQNRRLDLVA